MPEKNPLANPTPFTLWPPHSKIALHSLIHSLLRCLLSQHGIGTSEN